eukprot:1153929-Pelagomonas_calceolata.AAC.1
MSAESLGPSSTSVLSCPQVHLAVHLAASTVLGLQVTYICTSVVVVINEDPSAGSPRYPYGRESLVGYV